MSSLLSSWSLPWKMCDDRVLNFCTFIHTHKDARDKLAGLALVSIGDYLGCKVLNWRVKYSPPTKPEQNCDLSLRNLNLDLRFQKYPLIFRICTSHKKNVDSEDYAVFRKVIVLLMKRLKICFSVSCAPQKSSFTQVGSTDKHLSSCCVC